MLGTSHLVTLCHIPEEWGLNCTATNKQKLAWEIYPLVCESPWTALGDTFKVGDSRSSWHEDLYYGLLDCDTMSSGRWVPTIQSNRLFSCLGKRWVKLRNRWVIYRKGGASQVTKDRSSKSKRWHRVPYNPTAFYKAQRQRTFMLS